MSTKIIRAGEVTPPTVDRLKSSITDHFPPATVSGDFGLRNSATGMTGLWPSYNAGQTTTSLDFCAPSVDVYSVAPWAPSFAFALQRGHKCGAVGLDKARMESETSKVFDLTEGRGIEATLIAAFSAGTSSLGAATVITAPPTGPSAVAQALALLESAAAATYAGTPTIFMPRQAASLLGEKIKWVGDKAYTLLGSKVIIGGGSDSATPGLAIKMYATGEVYIERSEKITFTLNTIPGDGSIAAGIGENMVVADAERMYRVAVDPIRSNTNILSVTATLGA